MIVTCLGATASPVFGRKPLSPTIPRAPGEAGCGTGGEKPECSAARILERITVVLDNDCQYWVKIYPITDVVWSKI